MALSTGRRRGGDGGLNAWPGYVDALSTLLMVIIFVLLVFVLAQGFLSVALSSRDEALDRLNRQVAELADILALERGRAEALRATLTRTAEELQAAAAARDALATQLRDAREERDRAGAERDGSRAERDRLAAQLADLGLAARGSAERLASLEQQLAAAQRRAEAAGGDTAQTLQRLTETGRTLAAEQQARARAETRGAELERALAESRAAAEAARRSLAELQAARAEAERQLAALREQAAALDRQARVDRATIEARLSDLARLTQEIRALTALRDQLEREAREAEARASGEQRRREAAEQAAAEQDRLRQAILRAATEESRARQAAERGAAEATRLGDSARAQVALLTQQLDELRAQLTRIAAALEASEQAGREKDVQIVNLGSRLNAALAARVEELQRYRSDFFGRLRDLLGERPEIRVVGDRFVFQSEVLFPPASAELSERGQQQIREIAEVLREISARIPPDVPWILRVDGHADRTPIRSPRFATNWELSAARAIAVAQLLIAAGLPVNRVAATAFGDNQPLDERDTTEALARNRRIELRLTDR